VLLLQCFIAGTGFDRSEQNEQDEPRTARRRISRTYHFVGY
jgi:hypothetical protein